MTAADHDRAGADPSAPEDDPTPFTTPPRLADASVAIVTTAGLHLPGQERWTTFDQSFRVIPSERRDVSLGHVSAMFDRSGFVADINVVYPIDRLSELAEQGTISRVAPRHLSFMGAQDDTMTTIRVDSGPAAAKLLREDGTDVVLLTPV